MAHRRNVYGRHRRRKKKRPFAGLRKLTYAILLGILTAGAVRFGAAGAARNPLDQPLYKLDAVMDGDIDEIIDTLITYDQAEKLKMEN